MCVSMASSRASMSCWKRGSAAVAGELAPQFGDGVGDGAESPSLRRRGRAGRAATHRFQARQSMAGALDLGGEVGDGAGERREVGGLDAGRSSRSAMRSSTSSRAKLAASRRLRSSPPAPGWRRRSRETPRAPSPGRSSRSTASRNASSSRPTSPLAFQRLAHRLELRGERLDRLANRSSTPRGDGRLPPAARSSSPASC